MIRNVLASIFAVLMAWSFALAGEAEKCDGHGINPKYQVQTGEAIQVQVTADAQTVDAGFPRDLGSRAVGAEIKFHVGAYDKDDHVCQIPMAPVKNYIQATEIKVEVFIKGLNDQPDRKITTVPLPTAPADPPQTDRAWDGTWTIPESVVPEGEQDAVHLVGKRLLLKFVGTVDDVPCSAPRHKDSDDEAVNLESAGYVVELWVEVPGLEIKTKRAKSKDWDAGTTSIAVGGVDSPIHTAEVEVSTEPELAEQELPVSFTAGRYAAGKEARLVLNGVSIAPGTTAMVLTDKKGKLTGTLISSDVLTSAAPCVISASHKSRNVDFVWDNYAGDDYWEADPPYFVPGQAGTHTLKLSLDGVGLDGHEIKFYVEKITYLDANGQEQFEENRPLNPKDLSMYAYFEPQKVFTDKKGVATTKLFVREEPADKTFIEIEMVAYDLSARIVAKANVSVSAARPAGPVGPLAAAAADTDRADSANKEEGAKAEGGEATVFLTFDDGPMAGTDDVISVLKDKQVTGTFFFVGAHVISDWRKNQIRAAQQAGFLVANHSKSHDRLYALYDSNPEEVLADFRANDAILAEVLGLPATTKFPYARFPGADCWRVGDIARDVKVRGNDTKKSADLMKTNGYKLYGWDLEWRYARGTYDPIETPQQMIQQVKEAIDGKRATETPKKIVLLTHDPMFREKRGNKVKLATFIQGLKDLAPAYKITFKTLADY